jgi:hypothetical protein
MKEPLRHSASVRNRRKALHHAKDALRELLYLHSQALRLEVHYRHAINKMNKTVNRLKSEVWKDENVGRPE